MRRYAFSSKIEKVNKSYLEVVAQLFDSYRQFYGQEPNLSGATAFIADRLTLSDSVIFLALDHQDQPLGFAQLYPSYSSVAMKRMWYLNDLFVDEAARKQGVGKALLQQVQAYALETEALTVKLATAADNEIAKNLYISEGYSKVTAFEHYTQKVAQA
ncbi:GNAT family N-acetyltransferase [Vibrio parahaemolyticus]|nr:GNAT family N-acetyltransferase [Vibrio parahaemolyticus]ELA9293033.1 GNAT family N-acetyltransferase [Vibrio parahaemolyticus]MBM5169978.1 GNAT family N-acetyltransferase [Vibrio parahaemolyticus]MCR9972678.1 GNAT family N-acetyltransferase [Vibrio parahaemolyticus]MCS0017815.1 GNAT family N-acetyltransferase [Vibrio parahaemolyticus]MCS0056556.1 GNAT family N-acetyltransferase [Vibrio parahaemolyticus]